jgi:hypothetical protein
MKSSKSTTSSASTNHPKLKKDDDRKSKTEFLQMEDDDSYKTLHQHESRPEFSATTQRSTPPMSRRSSSAGKSQHVTYYDEYQNVLYRGPEDEFVKPYPPLNPTIIRR